MILYLKYPKDWTNRHLDPINFVAMEQDYKNLQKNKVAFLHSNNNPVHKNLQIKFNSHQNYSYILHINRQEILKFAWKHERS